jgi:ectoine hydroxylase-related dioxygenase (phytanoyl-CoA dioxygenase family)
LSPTQNEVDPKRMPHILEQCPIEYCELGKGDALIFHCNAIHRSDANRSASRRWTLLICYNRVDNDTIIKSDDRYFVPLEAVDDEALRQAGLRFASGDNREHFASRPYVPDLRKAS